MTNSDSDAATETHDALSSIRARINRSIPDEEIRGATLRLMANAVQLADDEHSDKWHVRQTTRGLVLLVGREKTVELTATGIRIGVIGTLPDETLRKLELDASRQRKRRGIRDAALVTLPFRYASDAERLLSDALELYIARAAARAKKAVDKGEHEPSAIDYLTSETGLELRQPGSHAEDVEGDGEELEAGAHAPMFIGRTGSDAVFDSRAVSLLSLVEQIAMGQLALPDLQRPFVWENKSIKRLFESLFQGFPIGTLMIWRVSRSGGARAFGSNDTANQATTLVIDGQQRLTALYAVIRGAEVTDSNNQRRKIRIAFRPRDGHFAVGDAANLNDPEFLDDIGKIWRLNPRDLSRALLERVRARDPSIGRDYEDAVEYNLRDLENIGRYQLNLLEIRPNVSDEKVADIFVRINSSGRRLQQTDFVMTQLSVYAPDIRDSLETFARQTQSPDRRSAVFTVTPPQMLRAAAAVGLGRAHMPSVYQLLRGADPRSGDIDPAVRKQQLQLLSNGVKACTEATAWRDFRLCVRDAGFVVESMIPSSAAVMNAYAFYILGKDIYRVEAHRLSPLISRWIFGTLITARYSTSSETRMNEDLARVKEGSATGAGGFEAALQSMLDEALTPEWFRRTLVALLDTNKAIAPAAAAFRAAQVKLNAKVLFGSQLLRELLEPLAQGKRAAMEIHHLFPKQHLSDLGVHEPRRRNHVANLTPLTWRDNGDVGSDAPKVYVPRLRARMSEQAWVRACLDHALPARWETMDYDTFLRERRTLMAALIEHAYAKLCGRDEDDDTLPPERFVPGSENVWRRIMTVELQLRAHTRACFVARFGDRADDELRGRLPEGDRRKLEAMLLRRPLGHEPLAVVDRLTIGQLLQLLRARDLRGQSTARMPPGADAQFERDMSIITTMRNRIAHPESLEIEPTELMRCSVACDDVARVFIAAPAP